MLLKFNVLFFGFVEPQPVFMSFSVSTGYILACNAIYKSSDSKRQVYTGAWSCGLHPDIDSLTPKSDSYLISPRNITTEITLKGH